MGQTGMFDIGSEVEFKLGENEDWTKGEVVGFRTVFSVGQEILLARIITPECYKGRNYHDIEIGWAIQNGFIRLCERSFN